MIIKLLNYFTGTLSIAVKNPFVNSAVRLILEQKLIQGEISQNDDGIVFSIRGTHMKRWEMSALHHGIEYEVIGERGLPKVLRRYKGRWGIAAGIGIFAVITLWSSSVIWNIDVIGNSQISDSNIKSWLEEQGCHPGTFIKGIDFDSLHNNVMLSHPEIAWISVNVDGTQAHVEVKEVTTLPVSPKDGDYTNVVAGEDGQIELVYVYEGKPVVRPGDAVQKGDLIISGAMSVGESGVRFERGRGKVKARVRRSFEVEIPYDYEKSELTGRSESKKSIIFFGKRINLFINSGIPYANYDTIEYEDQIKFFDRFEIPVWLCSTIYSERQMTSIRLSKKEAVDLAEMEFTNKLNQTVGDGELLTCDKSDASDDQFIRYICKAVCSDDIGVEVPISVENNPGESVSNESAASQ